MSNRCATCAQITILAASLLSIAGCDQSLPFASDSVPVQATEVEQAVPSVFDTALEFKSYGNATEVSDGNSIKFELPGGGEGGIALSPALGISTDSVITFSLVSPSPMNLRLTRPDGSTEYLSTENRGHIILGPNSATEALIYGSEPSSALLTVHAVFACGGSIACDPDGELAIRVGDPGQATSLLAAGYGAVGLSAPGAGSVTATRGVSGGEFGFFLRREIESTEPLLVEYTAEAAQPINVLVQTGERKEYLSSTQGWVRFDPGSILLFYTPNAGAFELKNIKVSACVPEEPRCLSEPAP